MEHLTKQQIVLLTLLVSFVTSIATGIVAVSLMNQAPVGVTQTINHVIERTIERVTSDPSTSPAPASNNATAVLSIQDVVAQTVDKVSKSIVRLKSRTGDSTTVTGIGLVISKEGVIVTDKTNLAPSDLVAVFSDGKEFPVQVLQSQILGDVVFLAAIAQPDYVFYPASSPDDATSSMKLGETVLAIGGKDSDTLVQGLISKVSPPSTDGSVVNVETTLSSSDILPGSPLFSIDGGVIGMKTSALIDSSSFYPLTTLKAITPVISR